MRFYYVICGSRSCRMQMDKGVGGLASLPAVEDHQARMEYGLDDMQC